MRGREKNMQTISSQRYTDEEIVAAKIAAEDFDVTVSPEFTIEGVAVRVVLDGHHSLAAAKTAGVAPIYSTADATQHDAVALIARGDFEGFLQVTHMGDDYYDVDTLECVW
jgi:hypothetical protein